VGFLGVGVPWFLHGQDTEIPIPAAPDETLKDVPCPLGPMLLTAIQKDITWRPDWAITVPPDAFTLTAGKATSITLILEGEEYRVCWENGALVEFPICLQGSFAQVQRIIRDSKKIKSLTIRMDISWNLELIKQEDPYRFLARLTGGEQVYFLAFQSDHTGISETWYDPEGNALGFFRCRSRYAGEDLRIGSLVSYTGGDETSEWYEYDSFGNISEIVAAQGTFSALYYQKNYPKSYPRYWERQVLESPSPGSAEEAPPITEGIQNYTLQWDEKGFLVGMFEGSDGNPETAVDARYEYTVDRRGNWTERQEIRMVRRLGVLMPSPGLTIKRRITYESGA
jgi:YD repeat-containing protein